MNDHYVAPGMAEEERTWRSGAYDRIDTDTPSRWELERDEVEADSPDWMPW